MWTTDICVAFMFLRKYTPIHTPPGTPTGMQLGMRLGGQRPEPNTESGATPGTREAAVNASPVPAQVVQVPVSKTIPDQYSLPLAPEQQSKNLSSVQPPPSPRTSTACWEWLGGTLSRSACFTTTDWNTSLQSNIPTAPDAPCHNSVCPTSTDAESLRQVQQGTDHKIRWLFQQINLKYGNYATDNIRLFRLEETNNMSSMSCTNQQQNTQLAWTKRSICTAA